MDIPVFHDDQHGTAIIVAAGVMNACHLTDRKLGESRLVVNGAGAAGIACLQMLLDSGFKKENAILCDTKGVIFKGRTSGMNDWKEKYINDTEARTLEEALRGADVFVGVSSKDALKPEWVKAMNPKPIIFALANPDPEILPEKAKEAVPDAIIATGRSDYPNQINNVMCFPYLFRGALDVRARRISEGMKVATAKALAELAREEVPDEVCETYGRKLEFGSEYIIPTPFDPRLLVKISTAVAKAASEDKDNAKITYEDWSIYEKTLQERVNRKYLEM
jgi:malate dehydrogenase (oxaloacetate-decarboxylating)(NADP+)